MKVSSGRASLTFFGCKFEEEAKPENIGGARPISLLKFEEEANSRIWWGAHLIFLSKAS